MQNGQNIKLMFVTVQYKIVLMKKVSVFAKPKLSPFSQRNIKQIRVQWSKKRLHWVNNEWRKVVFSDEFRICLGTGDNV